MTNLLNIHASERLIQGNTPLILNHRDTVWQIQSGSMAIFAVVMIDGRFQGARRYLFDVNAGEALFGIATRQEGCSHQLVAVAYEETCLIPIDLKRYSSISNSNGLELPLLELAQSWCDRCRSIFQTSEIPLPGGASYAVNSESLCDDLEQFHADFLCGLHQLEQHEIALREDQFHDRLRLNHQVSERAIGDLTAIFRPKEAEFLQEGTALLIAAGAVGRVMGMEISPPARSEDPKRVKDPLEAIARASRIRTRRVILTGKWWESDCGALLAYTVDGERPVAVLPAGLNRYEVFDPELRRRIPITSDVARQLSPVAFTFYRPLPDQALKSLDILKFSLQGRWRDLITIVLLGVATSLVGMITPQATGILMDQAIPNANRNLVFQIALGLLAVSFGSTLFGIAQNVATARVQTFADLQTQAAIWDRLLKLRVSFFRQYSTGDLQSRVSAIHQIREILSGTIMHTIFSSFFSLLNLGLLFTYSTQLALVALVIAIVNILVTNTLGILTRKKTRPLKEMQGDMFGLAVQLIGGVSKLRLAGAEERAFAYWARKYSQQLKLMLSTEVLEDGGRLFNTAISTASLIMVYSIAVTLMTQQSPTGVSGGATAVPAPVGAGLSTGMFLAFNAAFGTFIHGATSLSNTLLQVMEISILWERAKPIIEAVPEVDASKTDPGRLLGGVKLDRVSFRYQSDSPLTLDNVSIEAKPGEFIALVGPSGSGKSTTMRLLLGFDAPEDGTIYYDGQDLSGLDVTAVRRQLGVVLQNGRINSASIFENISGGALVTMDEAWEAARMAGFAQDIEQMPMGMHTVISEGGTNLSGGQRQRLIISRALVLKPKILIFDEATSALDNRTQAIVSESLEKMGVTRIVIAHRLSTIRNADRIYVIAAGQVKQQGTYDELMQQEGLFADLMARQIA